MCHLAHGLSSRQPPAPRTVEKSKQKCIFRYPILWIPWSRYSHEAMERGREGGREGGRERTGATTRAGDGARGRRCARAKARDRARGQRRAGKCARRCATAKARDGGGRTCVHGGWSARPRQFRVDKLLEGSKCIVGHRPSCLSNIIDSLGPVDPAKSQNLRVEHAKKAATKLTDRFYHRRT